MPNMSRAKRRTGPEKMDKDDKQNLNDSGSPLNCLGVSVIFVLIYFLVLVLVLVFQLFFRFSFVLVFIIFSF